MPATKVQLGWSSTDWHHGVTIGELEKKERKRITFMGFLVIYGKRQSVSSLSHLMPVSFFSPSQHTW
jgi:hypothetical protein